MYQNCPSPDDTERSNILHSLKNFISPLHYFSLKVCFFSAFPLYMIMNLRVITLRGSASKVCYVFGALEVTIHLKVNSKSYKMGFGKAVNVTSLDQDLKDSRSKKFSAQDVQEIEEWIFKVIGESKPEESLLDSLKDGVILCKLANILEKEESGNGS